MIRLSHVRAGVEDNTSRLLLHSRKRHYDGTASSVQQWKSCGVLAEEDGRFIRQVPPLNGEVCCQVESTGAEKAGTRVGFKRD